MKVGDKITSMSLTNQLRTFNEVQQMLKIFKHKTKLGIQIEKHINCQIKFRTK